jgi:hypothetical protein
LIVILLIARSAGRGYTKWNWYQIHKTFFSSSLAMRQDKLERLSGKFLSLGI